MSGLGVGSLEIRDLNGTVRSRMASGPGFHSHLSTLLLAKWSYSLLCRETPFMQLRNLLTVGSRLPPSNLERELPFPNIHD